LGFFVDNELRWVGLAANLISESSDRQYKIEFVKRLQYKYNTIDALNKSWFTSFSSWDELLRNTRPIINIENNTDVKDFLVVYAEKYFSQVKAAIKEISPNALYLGCRFEFQFYPADTQKEWVVSVASRYCDVVSFNRYRYTAEDLKPSKGNDYPIIVGEFHFGSLDRGLFNPGIKYVANQKERGDMYRFYITTALRNPNIVGAHWFQYYDEPLTGRYDGENCQIGFLTVGNVVYNDLINSVKSVSKSMYNTRTNK